MSYSNLYNDYYVVKTSTGEINTYPKTRLGMTKLFDYLMNEYEKFSDLVNFGYYCLKAIGNYRKPNKLAIQSYIFLEARKKYIDDFSYINDKIFDLCYTYKMNYTGYDYYLDQIKNSLGVFSIVKVLLQSIDNFTNFENKIYNKNDIVVFNGRKFIKKQYKNAVKRCEDCGSLYIDRDIYEGGHDMEDNFGENGKCIDCLINDGEYCRCDDCGEIVRTEDTTYLDRYDRTVCQCCLDNDYFECDDCGEYVSIDEENGDDTSLHVCNDCYNDHYARCEDCGRLINLNSDNYEMDSNGNYYCDSYCAENSGLHWSERHGEWREDCDNGIEHDYHDYEFNKLGTMPKNAKHYLGSGSEIEIMGSTVGENYDFWEEIYNDFLQEEKYGIISHDGSVDEEIVMQPMTEEYFNKFDWENFFRKLVSGGCTSHDNENCGSHIHYSAYYLGRNRKEVKRNSKKVVAFFENNWEELVKFSRRKEGQLLHWCKNRGFEITSKTSFDELKHGGRYFAVNLQNIDEYNLNNSTIEIRIPRGTLNAKTFRATVDFFRHIVRNAKRISWKNINNLNLWFKGIKDKNTIEYIKSRDCFKGQF